MIVETVTKDLTVENSFSNVSTPIEIIATIPKDMENSKKIPISLTICHGKSSESSTNLGRKSNQVTALQCYYYAIPNHLSSDTKKEVLNIPLLDTSNDWVREMTRKVAVIISKKYSKPCYVAWSSTESNNEPFSMDQLSILKNCIDLIQSIIPK